MNKDESDLIIAEQNKSTEEILKAVAKVKSDYHELCKLKDMRIADLEKENAELKERNAELRGMYVHSAREAGTYKQFLEAKEKENAELKKELKDANKKVVHLACNQNKDLKRKINKAKEIIKTFLGFAEAFGYSPSMDKFITDAEQFLSEVENV